MAKLFHAVVVSSSVLLAGTSGCASLSTGNSVLDSASMDAGTTDTMRVEVDASTADQGGADTQDVRDETVDRRCLEGGWPTTKGRTCELVDASVSRCCDFTSEPSRCFTAVEHEDGCVEVVSAP